MTWSVQASRQGGLVTRGQLLADGVTRRVIESMVGRGQLRSTAHRGVYAVVGAPFTDVTRAWQAVLGSASPLSYLTAARWWQMEPIPADVRVHITRYDRRRLTWPVGVRVHRVALAATDVVEVDGMPVTSRIETALDCLGWLALPAARRFGDRAVQQGWLHPDDIVRRLTTRPGRWGNRQLRILLAALSDGAAAESERLLHALLRRSGVRGWRPNYPVRLGDRTYLIDAAIPGRRLAIEVDGYRHHSSVAAFQRDRARQNALVGAGWTVLRFTWWDLVERPDSVVAAIVTVLAA